MYAPMPGIPTVLYGAGPRAFSEALVQGADERLHLDDLSWLSIL
jgi:hypothetical protein